jgi:hypothetical protein
MSSPSLHGVNDTMAGSQQLSFVSLVLLNTSSGSSGVAHAKHSPQGAKRGGVSRQFQIDFRASLPLEMLIS